MEPIFFFCFVWDPSFSYSMYEMYFFFIFMIIIDDHIDFGNRIGRNDIWFKANTLLVFFSL